MRNSAAPETLLACRLCWRVTLAVFALILAVESVILVPSARRFEGEQLRRIADEAIIAIEPTLAASGYGANPSALAEGVRNSIGKYGIAGVLVSDSGGATLASAGETRLLAERLAHAAPMAEGAQRSADGARLDLAWPSGGGLAVAVRADASGVAGEVRAYVLRVAGLVGLIVLFVTAGTMFVVHRGVLRPVLQLRSSALAAAADPDHAERHAVATRRADEVGELIGAHNEMLARVAQSKRRDRELAEERARHLSRHQPLTGLPNREALVEHLERLGTRTGAPGRCVSVLLVNLVEFRVLNASFGAERCDALLRELAARLQRAAPARDFVAHLGADRFALVHEAVQCGAEEAAALAETLLRELGQRVRLGDAEVAVAVRIGISRAESGPADGRALLTEAQLALPRADDTDAARYSFYSPALAERARERQSLARDLERAIERGELFPVLQPKLALEADGGARLAGAEALLRWRHPERGLVRPDVVVSVAESTGLITPIGEFMLGAACGAAHRWRGRYGWAPRIAVNLSAQQFADARLPARIAAALAAGSVGAPQLELEITETAAMKDVAASARTLGALRELGVRVSIDDFGTGYSSLNYLRRFAVDAIKIDKSFVDDIGQDANADAVCDAILRLGHSIGTRVVAEGVETERQLAFLHQRRCDEVQGYLFGKPVPLDEFERTWLCARAAA